MQIETLPGVGAEITGIDLKNLSAVEFAAIRQAYADHGVIFFRDQDLSEEDHIAFAERWAPINVNRFFAAHPDYPQIAMVAKEKDQKDNIGGGWHTDHSYDVEPAMGSILVARELPESGGDTMFASMYRAYETLDDATKQEIDGLQAVHSAKHIFGSSGQTYYNTTDAGGNRIGNSAAADVLADVTHPVVIKHPLSGKKALYVNPAFTVKIVGKTDEQSQALLSRLYAHAMDKAHAYRFQWQPGSVAFWDNRSTWHWAMNDYHSHRRIMHRITLEGCALN
ncbi:TauD/TfdA dioxygenase family protein [Hyphomonas jannaschiana]|uniref:TauD/TfdA family dioxygenase n=1 Tax=Hyphomonas jannaschiana VP2 TaxID=1280952 RepID=A0A059FHN2_9PROT|nr:TauD/TfdA family dioxygenase [Hyphomonas jannaschiana]KCZ90154.1 TauD/TfdA family dioxygenase [Hyphomonas jannaschiana VP2]